MISSLMVSLFVGRSGDAEDAYATVSSEHVLGCCLAVCDPVVLCLQLSASTSRPAPETAVLDREVLPPARLNHGHVFQGSTLARSDLVEEGNPLLEVTGSGLLDAPLHTLDAVVSKLSRR